MLIEKDIWVHLEDNRGEQRLFKIGQGKKYNWRKHKFELSILIGKPYYTFYKIDHEDKISQVDQSYFSPNDEEQVEEITKTNKEIFDRNESQKLKEDDIYQLKQQEEGEDIIKKLIENSETFEKKTEYSQAKYLKRKKEKYLFCFIVKPTTIENVQKTWYKDNPARINYLREDTLAIFMQFAGINQKANILMFDNSYGMGLAAVAERLDGEGILSLISHGKHTLKDLVPFQSMNFNEEIIKSIQLVENYDQFLESYSHILICGEFNLKEIFEKVNDKLMNGGVVVVFSSFLEKLGELAELMNKSQKYTQVVLVDTFLRYHQVLLNRTHPKVDMDAYGGYVLQAYKIE